MTSITVQITTTVHLGRQELNRRDNCELHPHTAEFDDDTAIHAGHIEATLKILFLQNFISQLMKF